MLAYDQSLPISLHQGSGKLHTSFISFHLYKLFCIPNISTNLLFVNQFCLDNMLQQIWSFFMHTNVDFLMFMANDHQEKYNVYLDGHVCQEKSSYYVEEIRKNLKKCRFLIFLMDKVSLILLMVHKRQQNYFTMDN